VPGESRAAKPVDVDVGADIPPAGARAMTTIDHVAAAYPHRPDEDDLPGGNEPVAYSFDTEAAARAWVAQDPERRRYRGAQRRLFEIPTTAAQGG